MSNGRQYSHPLKKIEPVQAVANNTGKGGMVITDNRSTATVQLKRNIKINDDADLEKEADAMGSLAMQGVHNNQPSNIQAVGSPGNIIQRVVDDTNGEEGDIVEDNKGERFILVKWDRHAREWKVRRVKPGGEREFTYRRASELDMVEGNRENREKRRKDDDSPRSSLTIPSSSALLPPAPTPTPAAAASSSASLSSSALSSASSAPKKKNKAADTSRLSFAAEFEFNEDEDEKEITKPKIRTPHDLVPARKLKAFRRPREERTTETPLPPPFSSAPSSSAMAAMAASSSFSPSAFSAMEAVSAPKAAKAIDFPDVGAIVKIEMISKTFKTAMRQSQLHDPVVEYGGYIFWNPLSKEYFITKPVSGGKAMIDLDKPSGGAEGFILVANYHTHPDETGHQPPSHEDVMLSSARGVPSIVIDANGTLHFSGPTKRREGGESHNYPVPDPKGGYTPANTPAVRLGEFGRKIEQAKK